MAGDSGRHQASIQLSDKALKETENLARAFIENDVNDQLQNIKELLEKGVKIVDVSEAGLDVSKGKLVGVSFCFTGALEIKRKEAQEMVKNLGGECKSSVSKGLTYLVQADPGSQSTKAKKARGYGTKVIGEKEFLKIVGS